MASLASTSVSPEERASSSCQALTASASAHSPWLQPHLPFWPSQHPGLLDRWGRQQEDAGEVTG